MPKIRRVKPSIEISEEEKDFIKVLAEIFIDQYKRGVYDKELEKLRRSKKKILYRL